MSLVVKSFKLISKVFITKFSKKPKLPDKSKKEKTNIHISQKIKYGKQSIKY